MLANNIIRQFFTQIIGLVSGVVISIVTARILGPSGRGDLSLLLNTSGFLSLLIGFSIGNSIVHVISSGKMQLREVVNTFSIVVFSLILLCSILLFFFPFQNFSFLLPNNYSEDHKFYLLALLFIFIISILSTLFNSVLSGKKLFKNQQAIYIITTLISLGIYCYLYFIKAQINFNFFVFLYLITAALPAIGAYIGYFIYARPRFDFSFLNIVQSKYVMGFSFIAYLCSIFQFLSYRMDFWFVKYFNGSEDLGYYSLAVNLAQMIWLIPQAIGTILISYSGAATSDKAIQNTNTLSRIASFLLLFVSIILVFFIDFIIEFLYGINFIESALLFKLLLLGIIPFSITTILASYFIGVGKIKINLYCSLIGFSISLIIDFILIPKFGNVGAAIATIIAYFISTAFIIAVYMHLTKSTLSDLLLINKLDKNLISAKVKSILIKNNKR